MKTVSVKKTIQALFILFLLIALAGCQQFSEMRNRRPSAGLNGGFETVEKKSSRQLAHVHPQHRTRCRI